VVVGYGAAGAAAAIAAHDSGAKVLILEKAPERFRGGSSRVSGNAVFFPTDVEKAILYFNAMAGPYRDNISDEMVRVWAEEMYNNRAWLQRFNQLKHVTHIFPLEKILDTGEQ
jgi:succinate dehydrogenase/fumarate reductase flavoprotein subunit